MTKLSRAFVRALIPAGVLAIALLWASAPAFAHVRVDADDVQPGDTALLTFSVPNESENGSLTTQFNVRLPSGTGAMTEPMPGWTVRLDRDGPAGTINSVTWSAAPGTGIPPDQFALFRVSMTLPKEDTVSFPAVQTYSDGTAVRWDQPPLTDGGESELPVPTLSLTRDAPAADVTARWLAVGGLVVGALAAALTALTLVRRPS